MTQKNDSISYPSYTRNMFHKYYDGLDKVRKEIAHNKTRVTKYEGKSVSHCYNNNGEEILVFSSQAKENSYLYLGTDANGTPCTIRLCDLDKDGNIDEMHVYYRKDGVKPTSLTDYTENDVYECYASSSQDNGFFDEVKYDNRPIEVVRPNESNYKKMHKTINSFFKKN